MAARFFTKVGPLAGASFEIGEEAEIGRAAECAIRLESTLVSGRHARIAWDPETGAYSLEDLGSLNGTALDGMALTGRERLGPLHVITLAGQLDFLFQELAADEAEGVEEDTFIEDEPLPLPDLQPGAAEAPAEPAAPAEDLERTFIDREMLPLPSFDDPSAAAPAPSAGGEVGGEEGEETADGVEEPATRREDLDELFASGLEAIDTAAGEVPPAVEAPALEEAPVEAPARRFQLWLATEAGERIVDLRPGENLLGRVIEAAIQVEGSALSRRHATLVVEGAEVRLRDEGSRNGTFLEEEPIVEERPVAPGARLRFGNLEGRLIEIDGTDRRSGE